MFEETNSYNDTEPVEDKDLPLDLDPLKKYFTEVQKYPLLTEEEESRISRLVFERHDRAAAQKLIVSNLRLVAKIARGYYNTNLNILDLIQEGNVGLLRAVEKYNPDKGTKFSTYSSYWIRAYILKHIMDTWSLVKVGTTQSQRKLFYRLNGEKQRLEAIGIYPTRKLLASNFGLKECEVEDMEKRLSCSDTSLDVPVYDGSEETQMDRISSNQDVEEIISCHHRFAVLSKMINKFKATLEDRDRYIFDHRVIAEKPMSLRELGDSYNISRERVRQVETKIIKRFKAHLQESLADFDLQNTTVKIGTVSREV